MRKDLMYPLGLMRQDKWLICFYILCLVYSVQGQSHYYRPSVFNHLSVDEGLAHRTCISIAQDKLGYIWFGTRNGLNRFDGYGMEVFRHDIKDSLSLSSNLIMDLKSSYFGGMWILTENHNLSYFNSETESFIELNLRDPDSKLPIKVRAVEQSMSGNIYLLSGPNIIYILDHIVPSSAPIYPRKIQISSTNDSFITKILYDSLDRLWIHTSDNKLSALSSGKNIKLSEQSYLLSENSRIINLDQQGLIWILEGSKLMYLNSNLTNPFLRDYYDLQDLSSDAARGLQCIQSDLHGGTWLALYGHGLLHLEFSSTGLIPQLFYSNTEDNGAITNQHITTLYVDRYSVLWIGSESGVFSNHLNQKPFYLIDKGQDKNEGLISNIVQSVFRNEFLWVGTRKGLTVIDTQSGFCRHFDELGSNICSAGGISCFLEDSHKRLWIGTPSRGLYLSKLEADGKFTFTSVDKLLAKDSPTFRNINIMEEDHWGRLWIGSGDGVIIVDTNPDGKNTSYVSKPLELAKDWIVSNIAKDPYSKDIWISTWNEGLKRIQFGSSEEMHLTEFRHVDNDSTTLSNDHVNPLVWSAQDTLWIGTIGGGICRMTFENPEKPSLRVLTTHDGLPDNTIHVLEFESDYVWLGTTSGLAKINIHTEEITLYNKKDGLQSNLFIVNASHKDSKGRLYFGGPGGLTFFNPDDIHKEKTTPDVVIKRIKTQSLTFNGYDRTNADEIYRLHLNERENDVTFDMTAVHMSSPDKNQLRYRLLGHQDDWIIHNKGIASINYSNLSPGSYVMQAMARNGDGVWSPPSSLLKLTIKPYWYKSKLAFVVYFVAIISLLWAIHRIEITQNKLRSNLELTELRREKEQEIVEIKTRFFNNMTHELRTPLTLIKGPIEELMVNEELDENEKQNYYRTIDRNARRLFRIVNRILQLRKSETPHFKLQASQQDIIPFLNEIYLTFQQLARDKNITYEFSPKQEYIETVFDNEKLEIIFANLLSNAFKYSEEGDHITVEVSRKKQCCSIKVIDTGRGIDIDAQEKIFDRFYQSPQPGTSNMSGTGIGLSLVKTLVELHAGEINVDSTKGEGSTFEVLLPLSKNQPSQANLHKPSDELASPQIKDFSKSEIERKNSAGVYQKKLLVVEDNGDIRSFIRSLFQASFRIYEAKNGIEGLQILDQHIPDLIISDIMMEGMDGITFCEKIRGNVNLFHLPIILLTARTSTVYQIEGLNSGADAYITKPFSGEVLRAQVQTLLKSRSVLRSYYHRRVTLTPQSETMASKEMMFIEELITLIENKIDTEFTVEDLATDMSTSHSTLYRKVKTYTGHSVNSFIRSVRLKQAAQLLLESTLNISETAYKVGFADLNYFGKCFKAQFGKSPTQFVKDNKVIQWLPDHAKTIP